MPNTLNIRTFILEKRITPEWGQSRKSKDKYFITDNIDKLLKFIKDEHGYYLEKIDDSHYKRTHYYSMDREELELYLYEIFPTEVINYNTNDEEEW